MESEEWSELRLDSSAYPSLWKKCKAAGSFFSLFSFMYYTIVELADGKCEPSVNNSIPHFPLNSY